MPAPALHLDDLTLAYRRHPAVHHLSGDFAPGSFTAVVGPNGAGKSTLLKGLAGLLRPASGTIRREPADPGAFAYLPQQAEIDRSMPLAVADLVAMGLWRRLGAFAGIGGRERARIDEALHAVGLQGFRHRAIGTLSGGQLQRALFARMLLQDARLLLLDEPFTAIDAKTSTDLLALVRRWHGEGRTIVTVLHDLDLVRAELPETLLLAREPVAWGPTAQVLTAENLLKARAMCEAFQDDAPVCGRAA